MTDGPGIAVIGGGVIGGAIAWRLARRGAPVTLLERGDPEAPPAGQASTAAAGMLAPLKEAEDTGPFMQLGIRSMERYSSFVREVETDAGFEVGYRRDGRLDVALGPDEADRLRRQQSLQAEAGYESRLLDPDEVRALEPAIGPEAVLGLATDYDHQVDADRLTHALWKAVRGAGADVRARTRATGVAWGDAGVEGVRLESGETVPARQVVIAAGAWSGRLELPRELPVRPIRGQIVRLRTAPGLLKRTVWGPHVYLVPRGDGRVLVGSTMEDVGYDARVTAGGVARLLRLAAAIVPELGTAEVTGFQVGLRPAASDGLPIIGPDPDVAGVLYATGHLRNGILLAPETAHRVASMALDGAPSEPAFDPVRFQS